MWRLAVTLPRPADPGRTEFGPPPDVSSTDINTILRLYGGPGDTLNARIPFSYGPFYRVCTHTYIRMYQYSTCCVYMYGYMCVHSNKHTYVLHVHSLYTYTLSTFSTLDCTSSVLIVHTKLQTVPPLTQYTPYSRLYLHSPSTHHTPDCTTIHPVHTILQTVPPSSQYTPYSKLYLHSPSTHHTPDCTSILPVHTILQTVPPLT